MQTVREFHAAPHHEGTGAPSRRDSTALSRGESSRLKNQLRSCLNMMRLLPVILGHNIGGQKLQRIPEPESVMDGQENVANYDRALETQLSIAYAIGLKFIYEHLNDPVQCGKALDLACGTGHFTLALREYLGFDEVVGLDLSSRMLSAARANAQRRRLPHVTFHVGDVTDLSNIPDNSVELCCFNQAAHHMPDLEHVAKVLAEADRVTKPNGLVLVTDLLRLRTESITEAYVRRLTKDYAARGLDAILSDFRNSMYAAWTLQELRTAEPSSQKRIWSWHHPFGLPTFGVALGSQQIKPLRSPPDWAYNVVPDKYLPDARMIQGLMARVR